jgi:DNA-binding CsgD family transcriptional regulator
MREQTVRRIGIPYVDDLPWGAHICMFYESPQDLIDAHVAYFGAGLEDGEFCVWAISEPVTRQEAIAGLRAAIPSFDEHLNAGRIELLPGYDWYLGGGDFSSHRITAGWHRKLAEALTKGFSGMRVSGNAFWMERNQWKEFREYEIELDRSLEAKQMIVLCTYCLKSSRATDLIDVARTHHFTITRRNGRWEFLETPELRQARRVIGNLNDAIDILSMPFPGRENLTPQERVNLAQIVKGATSKEAARALNVSPRTVEFHRANVLRKLGARNHAALITQVLRRQ